MQGTYGFKQWDELNDEARAELEQDLVQQAFDNLALRLLQELNESWGDIFDAHNVPKDEASEMIHAAFFDGLMDEIESCYDEPADFMDNVYELAVDLGVYDERAGEADGL